MRVVTRSKAYQLTSKQSHASHADPKRFARVAVKSISGEQLFDSLSIATGYHDGSTMRDRQFFGVRREFITKFGSTEKLTEKQTSILQALTLMNGRFVNDQTSLDVRSQADPSRGREIRQLCRSRRRHGRQEESGHRCLLGAVEFERVCVESLI
jgi:predicted amino acid racemase